MQPTHWGLVRTCRDGCDYGAVAVAVPALLNELLTIPHEVCRRLHSRAHPTLPQELLVRGADAGVHHCGTRARAEEAALTTVNAWVAAKDHSQDEMCQTQTFVFGSTSNISRQLNSAIGVIFEGNFPIRTEKLLGALVRITRLRKLTAQFVPLPPALPLPCEVIIYI